MRAVVTGANGFIGSHLVERLVADGASVLCIVRPSSNLRWLSGLPVRIHTVTALDSGLPCSLFEDCDIVFHAAGLTRGRSLEEYISANVVPTRRLLETIVRSGAKLGRFVYISSLTAFGPAPSDEPPDENAEPHPRDWYGASKHAAERAVLEKAGWGPVTIIRPAAVYGPRDANFLPLFRMAARGIFPMVGSPARKITLVHVSDLVEAAVSAAAAATAPGKVYFVGGDIVDYRGLASAFGRALGKRLLRLRIPAIAARLAGELGELYWSLTRRPQIISRRKVNDMLQPRWICNWARAAADLGYAPRVELVNGLRQTAEWYRSQGWL